VWKEYFVHVADFLPLTASSTGDAFQDKMLKIATDSHFDMIRTIYQATNGAINLRIINNSTGEEITRPSGDIRAISSSAYSGITSNGFIPYLFPRPYTAPADSELLIQAADKSNASNYFRLAIHGNKIYGWVAPYEHRTHRQIFELPFDMGSVAAYDTVTKNFVMDSSAGFLVSKLTGSSAGTCTIFIKDIRPWSSGDVHFYNMVGNSQFGNNLTAKRWLPERAVVTIRVTDLSGVANRIKLTLHGERVLL